MEKTIVCTTNEVPGYEIKKYCGLVWASSSRSKHLGHDFYAVLKTVVGGKIKAYEQMTNHACNEAVRRLAENAERMGANAVVGVRMEGIQLLQATVDVVAYGTAVVIEKKGR